MVKISETFPDKYADKKLQRQQIKVALHWKTSIIADVKLKEPVCLLDMEKVCDCPPGTTVIRTNYFDYDYENKG